MAGKTLYDKLWEMHEVKRRDDGSSLIYIDRHILHEVTSPQAFEGLRLAGRKPWRIDANIATPDHNVPTTKGERQGGLEAIADEVSRIQVQTLDENCDDFGILEFKMNDIRQGIVHVIGPEQGATLPGMTVVCGDSHTSTHGAFGALAHGIGTSEVEHVLATQCLVAKEMKNMQVRVEGKLPFGVTAKDIVLAVIGKIGTAGGNGHALEFAGSAIRDLSMEGRMTICNMSIEAGARVGLVATDATTVAYVEGRPYAPKGEQWKQAVESWKDLVSDDDAVFDTVVELDASQIKPQVSWGTSPEMVLAVDQRVPDPAAEADPALAADPQVEQAKTALELAGNRVDDSELAALKDKAAGGDMQARYEYAEAAFAAGDRDAAADELLGMFEADREWNESAAKAKLLQIFEAVGLEDPWVVSTRRRLSKLLFG